MPKRKNNNSAKKEPFSNSFFEKYKHPLWQKKRLEILELYGFECQDCGSSEKTLNVHHQYYKKGLNPWEYPIEDFDCLCEECHEKHHYIKQILNEELGRISISHDLEVLGFIRAIQLDCNDIDEIKTLSYEFIESVAKYFGIDVKKLMNFVINNNDILTMNDIRKLQGK